MKSTIQRVCAGFAIIGFLIGNQSMAQSIYDKDLFATGVGVLKKLLDGAIEDLKQGTDYETYFNEVVIRSYVETSIHLGGRPTMTGIKRVKEMGIDRTDNSKTYATITTVNVDSNKKEISKSETVRDGFTPIEGKQNFECDDQQRSEWRSLKIDTTYRVRNKVAIPARYVQKTAIHTHNIIIEAKGKIVPPCSVGSESESPRTWVIPVQVARLGYTDFTWDYNNSVIGAPNALYSRAEALAQQMFKDSYSTLPTDQKAKVDAILSKK